MQAFLAATSAEAADFFRLEVLSLQGEGRGGLTCCAAQRVALDRLSSSRRAAAGRRCCCRAAGVPTSVQNRGNVSVSFSARFSLCCFEFVVTCDHLRCNLQMEHYRTTVHNIAAMMTLRALSPPPRFVFRTNRCASMGDFQLSARMRRASRAVLKSCGEHPLKKPLWFQDVSQPASCGFVKARKPGSK